jgi:hypothetical protein
LVPLCQQYHDIRDPRRGCPCSSSQPLLTSPSTLKKLSLQDKQNFQNKTNKQSKSMAPASAPEPTYRKDEKVFCFHHELLYESKVLDVKPMEGDDKKSGFQYRVHYKGWKNT